MVRDLALDMKERDLVFTNRSGSYAPVFDTVWGNIFDEDEGVDLLILNVLIPEGYWRSIEYTDNEFVCDIRAAYKPDTRDFRIRLVGFKDGCYSLFSSVRGDFGVPVNSYAMSRNVAAPIPAAMLPRVDIHGEYKVRMVRSDKSELLDRAYLYSAKESDISVIFSDDQASQLLSLCAPGKSYRYPTTGVGITRYLNAVIDHTDLYEVLEAQFKADNKPIQSASFDSETCDLRVLCAPEPAKEDTGLDDIDSLDISMFEKFTDEYVRRNIVLDELTDSDFVMLLNKYDNVLNIILFRDEDTSLSRLTDIASEGRFNADGDIVEDEARCIVSATLEAGTIIMCDDEEEDEAEDFPVFIINDSDETRLYTSLIGQPYWITENCHKCFILNRRSELKYVISKEQLRKGNGLFVVEPTSGNLKNMLALVQDSSTGRLIGVVSSNTNISDVTLDEITQHIYAQLK